MKIKEASTISKITEHTLRYYEKLGLLNISRDANGHRNYNSDDILWIQFINRLKITGMSIKDIVKYSHLRTQGDVTFEDRLDLLEHHESIIVNNITKSEANLEALRKKILYYKENIL